MKKSHILFVFTFLSITLFQVHSYAQRNIKDSSFVVSMISASYSFNFVGGDLANRYGNNSTIGPAFTVKLKNNWLLGADLNFIFGNNVKIQNQIISGIATSDDNVISREGTYADIRMFERGYSASVKVGKVFPVFGSNPNSGIMFTVGGGILRHKIRIEADNNATPQLRDDYAKGYDRLSQGFQMNGFLGYLNLSNKRLYNFYLGVEFMSGWTKSLRDYNFDEHKKDTETYYNQFIGFKFGWIIPLYGRSPNEFYY